MSHTAIRQLPSTSAPGDGSRTITTTNTPSNEQSQRDETNLEGTHFVGALRLRPAKKTRQRVAWDEDVVDNEGCGRKKSKICCIYHKPRRFDESSDESSDSDSDAPCGHDGHSHAHSHRQGHGGSAQARSPPGPSSMQEVRQDFETNAYEAAPNSNKGKRRAD